jgi:sulfiredoxin
VGATARRSRACARPGPAAREAESGQNARAPARAPLFCAHHKHARIIRISYLSTGDDLTRERHTHTNRPVRRPHTFARTRPLSLSLSLSSPQGQHQQQHRITMITRRAVALPNHRPTVQYRPCARARPSPLVRASATTAPCDAATTTTATTTTTTTATTAAEQAFGWRTDAEGQAQAQARNGSDPRVRPVPVADIRRPLGRTRQNDQAKVAALMESIERCGLLEPIDVLEVEGKIYGFSGCHRYEAHVKLGKETILCRVRRATRETLAMHLR